MSAADAADRVDHTEPAVPDPGGAAVFHIGTRTHSAAARGRYTVPDQPNGNPLENRIPQYLLEHIEVTFNEHGMTLADDTVASSFKVTVGILRGLLAGAAAEDVITQEQRTQLDTLFDGITQAPRNV